MCGRGVGSRSGLSSVSSRITCTGSTHGDASGGKLRNAVYNGQSEDTGKPKSDRLRSLLLRLMRPVAYGTRSAFATDFCVELTATEFNRRAERQEDDNACAGSHPSNIKAKARDRARDNANNAIAPQCLNNVTPDIRRQACTRVQSGCQYFRQ
jgi:hypothetical protein